MRIWFHTGFLISRHLGFIYSVPRSPSLFQSKRRRFVYLFIYPFIYHIFLFSVRRMKREMNKGKEYHQMIHRKDFSCGRQGDGGFQESGSTWITIMMSASPFDAESIYLSPFPVTRLPSVCSQVMPHVCYRTGWLTGLHAECCVISIWDKSSIKAHVTLCQISRRSPFFPVMRRWDVPLSESIFVIVSPFLDSAEPPASVQFRAQCGRLC